MTQLSAKMRISSFSDQNTPTIEALFLDRDGTLIEDRHYLADPDGVCLLPGVAQGLQRLCVAGIKLFLVTNQSGIGRGYFSEEDMLRCQKRLEDILKEHGVHFDGMRFCPHTPEDHCTCRKPGTAMWASLAKEHGLDPSRCAMVGDKPDDILFGLNAGFNTCFLVITGKGAQSAAKWGAHLAPGQDLASLGNVPFGPGAAQDEEGGLGKAPSLLPIRGGVSDIISPAMPSTQRTALWLARDLNAVADKILRS